MKSKLSIILILLIILLSFVLISCNKQASSTTAEVEIIPSEIKELPIPVGSIKIKDIVTASDGGKNIEYESTLSLEYAEYLYEKYMSEWDWEKRDLDTSKLNLNLTFYDGLGNNAGNMALVAFEEKNERIIITLGIGPKQNE